MAIVDVVKCEMQNAEAGLGNGTYYCPDGIAVATMRYGKAYGILEG